MAIDTDDFLYGPTFSPSPLKIRAARAAWDRRESFEEKMWALPNILEKYDLDGSDFLTEDEVARVDSWESPDGGDGSTQPRTG